MRHTERIVLSAMLICTVTELVCLADTRQSIKKHPTAIELLDKYAQTQDKLKSSIIKSKIASTSIAFLITGNGIGAAP